MSVVVRLTTPVCPLTESIGAPPAAVGSHSPLVELYDKTCPLVGGVGLILASSWIPVKLILASTLLSVKYKLVPSPISVVVRLTTPVCPLTESTGEVSIVEGSHSPVAEL